MRSSGTPSSADDVAARSLGDGADRHRAARHHRQERPHQRALARVEELRRPDERQIVDDVDVRAGRGQRRQVVGEEREVGAGLLEHPAGVPLHPEVAQRHAAGAQAAGPLLGGGRRQRAVADQHHLVAGRRGGDERIDQVLGVVTDAGTFGGAGGDLDGEFHGLIRGGLARCLSAPIGHVRVLTPGALFERDPSRNALSPVCFHAFLAARRRRRVGESEASTRDGFSPCAFLGPKLRAGRMTASLGKLGKEGADRARERGRQGALRPGREGLPPGADGGGGADPGRGGVRQLPVRLRRHRHARALHGSGNGRLDDARAGPRSVARAGHRGDGAPAALRRVAPLPGGRGAGRAAWPGRATRGARWRCSGSPRWSTPSSTTCWRSSAGSSGWPTRRTSTSPARCLISVGGLGALALAPDGRLAVGGAPRRHAGRRPLRAPPASPRLRARRAGGAVRSRAVARGRGRGAPALAGDAVLAALLQGGRGDPQGVRQRRRGRRLQRGLQDLRRV